MSLPSVFTSAREVSRSTTCCCLQHLVSSSLVRSKVRYQITKMHQFTLDTRLSGRYPRVIEDVLRKYGDVGRIAPNQLDFSTPEAFHDIYSPASRGMEIFRKTDFQNRGANLGGIFWEEDPVKHHKVARKLSLPIAPTRSEFSNS